MEISEDVLCLFSAHVEERGDSYVIEVPDREITVGDIKEGDGYRVAILDTGEATEVPRDQNHSEPTPPVEEGDERTVAIDDIGDQGDGIARVERGYVVIVPDTEKGERVTVEVTDVRRNLAFAEVMDRQDYYE